MNDHCRHTFISYVTEPDRTGFLCHDCNKVFSCLPGEEPDSNWSELPSYAKEFIDGLVTFREALDISKCTVEDFKKTIKRINEITAIEEKVDVHMMGGGCYQVTSDIKKRRSDPEEVDSHFQNLWLTSSTFMTGLIMADRGWDLVNTKFNDIVHLETIEDPHHREMHLTVTYLDDTKQLIKLGMI